MSALAPAPTSLVCNGHRTFLKWHRARRRITDPAFTGRRILEGMAAGASVEVDLVLHAEDGFAVLHNLALESETTGHGPVRAASAATLRALHLRDNDGRPSNDHPVMLLEDLATLIARATPHPEALLQLDYKEDAAALSPRSLATFARALADPRPYILSAGDAEAVHRLAEGVPGLRVGYDPCHEGAVERLLATRAYPRFVADARASSPAAAIVYLDHRLVLAADDDGFDLVAAFQAAGHRVDAYTLQRPDAAGLAAARRLLALRVDQITTDDPEGLASALALAPAPAAAPR